jgi:fatty-acyl-CoA synthase
MIVNTTKPGSVDTRPIGFFLAQEGTGVVDDDRHHMLEAGHSGVGWLARSGNIPLGYLGDADKTAATFPLVDGVRVTVSGDRARLNSDGLIQLLGREAITINSGGEKIFAEEVEQAIIRHPAIDDVMVVGRPSNRWGQEVVAVIQCRPGLTAADDDIIRSTHDVLADYKRPKAIVRVTQIVRSPAGKADYAWASSVAIGAIE